MPLVDDHKKRQRAMDVLTSWVERILYFLHPDEADHPFITPASLHIPPEVIATLPSDVRVSVQHAIRQSMDGDTTSSADSHTSDLSESTAYLERFTHRELQWLVAAMEERLDAMKRSEEQQQRDGVAHPEQRDDWHGCPFGVALTELEVELTVADDLKTVQEVWEKAMKAEANDRRALEQFVELAELLVNKLL